MDDLDYIDLEILYINCLEWFFFAFDIIESGINPLQSVAEIWASRQSTSNSILAKFYITLYGRLDIVISS